MYMCIYFRLFGEQPDIEELVEGGEYLPFKLCSLHLTGGDSLLVCQVVQNGLTKSCKCYMYMPWNTQLFMYMLGTDVKPGPF